MLTAMAFLFLAQAYAEASPNKIPCYDESDYPSLTGTGTQDDPYILSTDTCLRIVNSNKDKGYYAKFSLNNKTILLTVVAATTDNKSCENKKTEDCLNQEKQVSMSIKDSNGDTRQCGAGSWTAYCSYNDYTGMGVKKGDYFINVASSDSEQVNLTIKSHFDDDSNFSSEIN